MFFSDLLALTSQLSEPKPEPVPPPPSDEKQDLKELKASLNEIELVQEAQGVQVSQLLEAWTALAHFCAPTLILNGLVRLLRCHLWRNMLALLTYL
jgi:hypothetical protein